MLLPQLRDLKEFARVSFDDDDLTLGALIEAAKEYVATATGRTFVEPIPDRARVVMLALAAYWYDQREPIAGDARVVPFHIRSLIHQLRDWQDPAVTEALAEDEDEPEAP